MIHIIRRVNTYDRSTKNGPPPLPVWRAFFIAGWAVSDEVSTEGLADGVFAKPSSARIVLENLANNWMLFVLRELDDDGSGNYRRTLAMEILDYFDYGLSEEFLRARMLPREWIFPTEWEKKDASIVDIRVPI